MLHDASEAGPELDEAVHQRVFRAGPDEEIHPYSTDESWAGIVVKKMQAMGWHYHGEQIERKGLTVWRARFDERIETGFGLRSVLEDQFAESKALAICFAAVFAAQSRVPTPGR